MFFVALATDYDGTLAHDGRVDDAALRALQQLKKSGRRLILVTGRELSDLELCFPAWKIFDLIVAENGALIFDPVAGEEHLIAELPPPAFVQRLRELGISPLSIGRSIVATWEPNETAVLKVIREMGLELQIIFNKGAVMVLPPNINKAAGLRAALERLSLSPHNVVGIGDAENDHAFLVACGCAVAVANALPAIKQRADIITAGSHGDGLIELVKDMADNDLHHAGIVLPRRRPVLGSTDDGRTVYLDPLGSTAMVAGSSGGGKSTIVTGLLERMQALDFQFCVVDPEGDYAGLEAAVEVGGPKQAPRIGEVVRLLSRPDVNVSINLLAIAAADRPHFFAQLLPELSKLRAATGRPHWLVIDEAHHLLPRGWKPAASTLPRDMPAAIFVTVHPEQVSPDALDIVNVVIGVGKSSFAAIEQFCKAMGIEPPREPLSEADDSPTYLWQRGGRLSAVTFPRGEGERRRHARKYAEGELGKDSSFYFRGADNRLKLRAQNLSIFLQLAEGVDETTWMHHLRKGHYSHWFLEAIKDKKLAAEAEAIERDGNLTPEQSLARIKDIVDRRYTAPAKTS